MSNVKTNIINIRNKDLLKDAANVLKEGGILIFPTGTVYGIGCFIDSKAIRKLYKIKLRPFNQPTAILISKKLLPKNSSSKNWGVIIPDNIQKSFQEGNITLLIHKKELDFNIPKLLIKKNKVGVRIPNHKWLQQLIEIAGPIVATSANRKGEPTPVRYRDIDSGIIAQADLIIKSTQKGSGQPSKIYDIEFDKYLR